VGFVADLAYKTRRLVETSATQEGLGNITKSVTFDLRTLEAMRPAKGTDEGKVINLVRGLRKEIDENPDIAPVLQSLRERADRILQDLENRRTTGLAAMDLLAAIATEKDKAMREAEQSGLSARAFGVYWGLKDDGALKGKGLSAMDVARETNSLLSKFPNAAVNPDELRRLRAALYRPLLRLEAGERARIVELIVEAVVA
jgi:type I restriction enzyme R subunit